MPPRILLIKTSSLGDVISNLPVVTDIARHVPGAIIDWVVEESFAALPRLHPALHRVIPVALRRWRTQVFARATWREIGAFRRALRAQTYDFVIDTQGLIKSAVIARAARGLRVGYRRDSIREPLAAHAYDQQIAVSWQQHAIARNRALAGAALGYATDDAPDYGIHAVAPPADTPYVVLLTATSRAEKLWPDEHWVALINALTQRGLRCVLPAGSAQERARATRLARAGAQVAPPLDLTALASLLAGARCVVGVDTGLSHLAGALGRPVVGLYCATDPRAHGVVAAQAVNLGGIGTTPSVADVLATLAPWLP